jgi:hypothetical protein
LSAPSDSAEKTPVILRTQKRKGVIISAEKNMREERQFCVQRSRQ